MFKGCFISKCKIENYRCETSKIYTVTQPDSIQEKLGSYLFMQSFVQDCIIQEDVVWFEYTSESFL